ncbi:hypothetical protein C8R47DRAFT_1068674 [Mycena vitilis]|nr:hypothetical protein C8R47DRAFT_1068674 [Mycena vitilis]
MIDDYLARWRLLWNDGFFAAWVPEELLEYLFASDPVRALDPSAGAGMRYEPFSTSSDPLNQTADPAPVTPERLEIKDTQMLQTIMIEQSDSARLAADCQTLPSEESGLNLDRRAPGGIRRGDGGEPRTGDRGAKKTIQPTVGSPGLFRACRVMAEWHKTPSDEKPSTSLLAMTSPHPTQATHSLLITGINLKIVGAWLVAAAFAIGHHTFYASLNGN